MKLRNGLGRLKQLEKHLKIPIDISIAGGLAYATSRDVAATAVYEGMYGLAKIQHLPHILHTSLEQNGFAKYLLSQFGLPSLAIATVVDAAMYTGFAYCAYKATNKFLERDGKWTSHPRLKKYEDKLMPKAKKIQNVFNKIPFIERLPSYSILLFATYMRLQAVNSWSVVRYF